jgi:hypothetical protein
MIEVVEGGKDDSTSEGGKWMHSMGTCRVGRNVYVVWGGSIGVHPEPFSNCESGHRDRTLRYVTNESQSLFVPLCRAPFGTHDQILVSDALLFSH